MHVDPNWVLVILTAVYVVATIFICLANRSSASATKAQTEEMKRQYLESSRARVVIRFDKRVGVERAIVLKNIGRLDAVDVTLSVGEDFLNDLNKVFPANRLSKMTESKIHIASEQEFWVSVGFAGSFSALQSQVARITVSYHDVNNSYNETTVIDFSQYDFMTTMQVNNTAIPRCSK